MKKIIFCTMLLFVAGSLFSQKTDPAKRLTSQDYLEKSKKQKTVAFVLLGAGAALITTGFLIGNKEEGSFDDAATGGIIGSIGLLSGISSIPLFIAAGRNKRKAMNASAYFLLRKNPAITQGHTTFHSSPGVSIIIRF